MVRKFKETRLGLFPEDWVVKNISDIFEIKAGGDLKKLEFSKTKQRGFDFPVYSNSLNDKGLYGFSKIYQYEKDCVTITARGDVGHAEYRDHPFCAIVRLLVLKPRIDISGYFIKNFINSKLNFSHVGAAVNQLTAPQISTEFIVYPSDIKEQKKIANILSNYDNLIENNEKRIKILEQIAKLIYEEWFVKFKFPGHEKVKMIDSKTDFGKIPEGWEVKKLREVINNIILGGTPSRSKEEYWGGNIPWIKSGELNELRVIKGTESITELGLNKSATKIMPKRTVLIAITGAILISMSEIELCANQSVIGLYGSQKVSQEYLYLAQKENIHQFISKMSGSAQQHVNKEIVSDSFILVPKKEIMEYFSENIKSVFDEITNLMFKNQNLRKTRDFLLPKLISGEVDVSGLDIKISEEVANT